VPNEAEARSKEGLRSHEAEARTDEATVKSRTDKSAIEAAEATAMEAATSATLSRGGRRS